VPERRITPQEQRLTANHYQSIFNNAGIGICVAATAGTIHFTNTSFTRMLGYQPKELDGQPWLNIIHPDDRQNHQNTLQRLKDGEQAESAGKQRYLSKTKQIVYCQVTFSGIRNHDGLVATVADISAQEQAQQQLQTTLNEKDILLKETLHRVKNNLQVITSMLSLQARALTSAEARSAIAQSERRVRVMAMAHDHIYRSPALATLSADKFLTALIADTLSTETIKTKQIKLTTALAPLHLNLDQAIIYGLIVSELLTNSLEHAFPAARPGTLHISLQARGSGYAELKFVDDGIGLPKGFNFSQSHALGLRLVDALLKKLGGQLVFEQSKGTSLTITLQGGE
jgi:PAS domain S-box-containing protein